MIENWQVQSCEYHTEYTKINCHWTDYGYNIGNSSDMANMNSDSVTNKYSLWQ